MSKLGPRFGSVLCIVLLELNVLHPFIALTFLIGLSSETAGLSSGWALINSVKLLWTQGYTQVLCSPTQRDPSLPQPDNYLIANTLGMTSYQQAPCCWWPASCCCTSSHLVTKPSKWCSYGTTNSLAQILSPYLCSHFLLHQEKSILLVGLAQDAQVNLAPKTSPLPFLLEHDAQDTLFLV
ncbi:uncharacterized protein B0H18DRAFT_955238 [Fomitopsis serialis]|uniref:uncharacterized protein n=1 Tax=Fomitopsis serialis TaxID=139415 RepID=UPI0020084E43|nr:uncharacterized protein B0H18DRAFT_955238 [Neoantrodia serialis]KAH9925189.1 hypothetical protein B0H18DRAFT_955238 [Neoantrodia serialis]